MTAKKLKIIGPYTPEHPGPFCTRDWRPARVVCRDMKNEFPIIGIISNAGVGEVSCSYDEKGMATYGKHENAIDLMNAEEVPVPREFWCTMPQIAAWSLLDIARTERDF